MDPGDLIRSARERNGLSQARLALRAGTTQSAISRLERGERSPSLETIDRLLSVMGEELVGEARPIGHDYDRVHLAAEQRLTPAQRVERGFAWNRFNDAMRAAGAAAKRERA